jgi:hypothetical protein
MSEALRIRLASLPRPKVGDRVRVYEMSTDEVMEEGRVLELRVMEWPQLSGPMQRKTFVLVEGLAAVVPIECCEVIG